MLLNCNLQHVRPLAMLAGTEGRWSPPTSGGPLVPYPYEGIKPATADSKKKSYMGNTILLHKD